ncbi:MAG: hypothetical protein ACYTBJ_01685 [Planctomycetota bacterium]|jgi:hypothetical protein
MEMCRHCGNFIGSDGPPDVSVSDAPKIIKQKDAEIERLTLSEARARDDCRRVFEAWKALKERDANRTETRSEPGQHVDAPKHRVVRSLDIADFPHPREWDLEDQLLKDQIKEQDAELERLKGQLNALELINGTIQRAAEESEARVKEQDGRLSAMREALEGWQEHRVGCFNVGEAALATDAGKPQAAVIAAAVKARKACTEPVECESPLWTECCHAVDRMIDSRC